MLATSARLLELLSLLQARREWSGAELADRLAVGPRTVRRDVERLRSLGYPIDARPGVAGGYRLGAGASLPPLLLDAEEAVAVAVGLRSAASAGVTGIEETSVRALAKLEQLLPPPARRRVGALASAMASYPGFGPRVDAEALATVAAAARDHERLRFGYRDREGA
ncbi:MAG TPA: HTH domain-containing protein, partial [Solirubrobacteraceae bacterium]|nr:HTH domain-containing protein [Solirubrobacteraceae bacterium]